MALSAIKVIAPIVLGSPATVRKVPQLVNVTGIESALNTATVCNAAVNMQKKRTLIQPFDPVNHLPSGV